MHAVREKSLKPPLVAEPAAQMLQLATAMEARNSLAAPQVAYAAAPQMEMAYAAAPQMAYAAAPQVAYAAAPQMAYGGSSGFV